MGLTLGEYRYDADMCIGCANCRWIDLTYVPGVEFSIRCPSAAYYSLDAWGAYGKMRIVPDLIDGKLEYTPKVAEIAYQCQMCGSCDAGCKRVLDLEVGLVLETLRIELVNRGLGPMPEHKKIARNIEESHNRWGAAQDKRFKWMPDDIKPAEKAAIVYFAGCSAYVHPEIPQATVGILNATKTEFMIMPDEWCCGYSLYSTGQLDAFKKQVEHNLEIIKKSGAEKVLVSCAEGYKTLKVDYPKVLGISTADLGFEVIHLTEYVDQLLKEGKLKFSNRVDMKVIYHDPCNLGRMSEPWVHWEGVRGEWGIPDPPKKFRRGVNGVYEPPRDILRSIPGIELVEMVRTKDNAWCCGAGGGVRDAFREFALWTAGERLKEVELTGAEAIVSGCPHCKENFAEAINMRRDKIKVYDISELILKAI